MKERVAKLRDFCNVFPPTNCPKKFLKQCFPMFPEAAISFLEDYPQAYNVGTVGSQRCGSISSKEDGIPADGSLGNQLDKLCSLTMFDSYA